MDPELFTPDPAPVPDPILEKFQFQTIFSGVF